MCTQQHKSEYNYLSPALSRVRETLIAVNTPYFYLLQNMCPDWFCVNLTQARVSREEGTSVEEMPHEIALLGWINVGGSSPL